MTAATAELDAATARLQAITRARAAGATWAQIGARSGVTAKQAKRGAHLLERDTRRQFLLAAQVGEPVYPEPGPAFTLTERQ